MFLKTLISLIYLDLGLIGYKIYPLETKSSNILFQYFSGLLEAQIKAILIIVNLIK
jgi:hypothetical protein